MKKAKEKTEGNRIQALLEIKGISQADLGRMTGLDKAHISKIINHKTKCVSLPIAYRIAIALDEPIENVFILKFNC